MENYYKVKTMRSEPNEVASSIENFLNNNNVKEVISIATTTLKPNTANECVFITLTYLVN